MDWIDKRWWITFIPEGTVLRPIEVAMIRALLVTSEMNGMRLNGFPLVMMEKKGSSRY
jgi:hypothetical protein